MISPVEPTRGSGVALALASIAVALSVGAAAIVTADLFGTASRVQHAANLAALAASDVASGLVNARPCGVARDVARAQGVRIRFCEVTEGLARVSAEAERYGLVVHKRAAAMPADGGVWQTLGR